MGGNITSDNILSKTDSLRSVSKSNFIEP